MENKPEFTNEKKNVGKTKSYNNGPPLKVRCDATKRKSFSLNEAVTSLDLALGRLKKSKLTNRTGDVGTAAASRRSVVPSDMRMDVSSPSSIVPGLPNASLMSMNFSHYELIRNLSCTTSNSEGAYSGATCNTYDRSLKDEHLEKYFRSIDIWHRKHNDGSGPSVHFELPDK